MTEDRSANESGQPEVEEEVIQDLDADAEDADEVRGGGCPSPGKALGVTRNN